MTGHGKTVTLTAEEVAGVLHAISFMSDSAWNEHDYKAMRDTSDLVERLENLR